MYKSFAQLLSLPEQLEMIANSARPEPEDEIMEAVERLVAKLLWRDEEKDFCGKKAKAVVFYTRLKSSRK